MSRTDAVLTAGVIKWFDQDRGYGFITTVDYREVFAHISQVSDDYDNPKKGDRVNFLEDMGKDGRPFARRIVVVKPESAVV